MISLDMAVDNEPEVMSEKATNDATVPTEDEMTESEWSDGKGRLSVTALLPLIYRHCF